jgi:hypothetical protein
MSRRTFQFGNFTPTATAATVALTNATYMAVKGGSGTQFIDILEIFVSGMAPSTSSPTPLTFTQVSTVETTPTALAAPAKDGPNDPTVAALAAPPVTFTAAAAGPQRSALTTAASIQVGLNAFGGIVKWNAAPAPATQFSLLGNTQPLGEAVLSCENYGTAGLVGAHIIYEPH